MTQTRLIACASLLLFLMTPSWGQRGKRTDTAPRPAMEQKYYPSNSYYFDRPAESMMEELPLGNGRLGMLSDGALRHQRVTLNESSMWSGSIDSLALNRDAAKHLPKIRELLFAGRHKDAEALIYKTFVCGGKGSGHGEGSKVPYVAMRLGASCTLIGAEISRAQAISVASTLPMASAQRPLRRGDSPTA